MKIATLITMLERELSNHGNIEVHLQGPVNDAAYESFFVVAEEYKPEDGGWAVNLRTWHS